MEKYRYLLEPYNGINSRFTCPSCQKTNKTFTRYIDNETGEYLPIQYGRCERENNCNYFLNPYSDGYNKDHILSKKQHYKKSVSKDIKTIDKQCSYVLPDNLLKSLKCYENNQFINFLSRHYGIETVQSLIAKYYIGTSSHWKGSTVFWQIDIDGKVRTGKIMQYNSVTGRRVKEPFNHIQWVHKVLKIEEFRLKQCLFGEHLLKGNNKPVAIVESEKTAIISSVHFPKFNWLAVGSITNLTIDRCKVLLNRDTYLFPDLQAFDKWNLKAKELGFKIFDYLELNATEQEKNKGLDLADFLILNSK